VLVLQDGACWPNLIKCTAASRALENAAAVIRLIMRLEGRAHLSPGCSWRASRQVACMWGAEMLKSSAVNRMGESASASPWAATAVASSGCRLSAPGDVPAEVGPFVQ
jgi:hypothetical protein